MKAALVVPRVIANAAVNLAIIERMSTHAISHGAGLVLLPEAVLTGLINNDDPSHDLPLAQTIPGPATERLGAFCSRHGVWLGFGLLDGTFELAIDRPTYADVDREFERVVKAGARPVYAPRDEPWNMRSSMIADPEGNLIEIGSWNRGAKSEG